MVVHSSLSDTGKGKSSVPHWHPDKCAPTNAQSQSGQCEVLFRPLRRRFEEGRLSRRGFCGFFGDLFFGVFGWVRTLLIVSAGWLTAGPVLRVACSLPICWSTGWSRSPMFTFGWPVDSSADVRLARSSWANTFGLITIRFPMITDGWYCDDFNVASVTTEHLDCRSSSLAVSFNVSRSLGRVRTLRALAAHVTTLSRSYPWKYRKPYLIRESWHLRRAIW